MHRRRSVMAWLTIVMACLAVASSVAGARAAQNSVAPAQGAKPILDVFAKYDEAFNAKDLDRLATFYHPDVTVYEGGGINSGWVDYRDRHLGPELKGYSTVKFAHANIQSQMLSADAAYVTSEYSIEVTATDGKQSKSGGLETDVLVRQNGRWLIRHAHTSARRQRPAGGESIPLAPAANHLYLGTVLAVQPDRVQVRTIADRNRGEETAWFVIDESTKVRRGDTPVLYRHSAITTGERIAVIVAHDAEVKRLASQVRLAAK